MTTPPRQNLIAFLLLLVVFAGIAIWEQRRIISGNRTPSAIDAGAQDPTIDPCTDFYQHACGGWIAKTEIPADRPQWSRGFAEINERNLDFLRGVLTGYSTGIHAPENPYWEKLGDYYAVCMDEAKAETSSLETLNGAAREITALIDRHALAPLLARLQLMGVGALFSVSSEQDLKDPELVIAAADQDGLALPDRDYYLSPDRKMKEVRSLYRDHVQRMFTLWTGNTREARSAAAVVLKLETQLARISMPRVERRDPVKVYHRLERTGLEQLVGELNWQDYFATLGHPGISALDVKSPAFFAGLGELLVQTPVPDLRTYLRWQLLRASASTLGKRFVDEQFRFASRALSGQKQLSARWKRCVGATEADLGFALARSFVEVKYGEEGKAQSRAMIRNIEKAFHDNLEGTEWMDEPTRLEAQQKLAHIFNKVGYPDKWRNYDTLKIDRQSYLGNRLAAAAFRSHYELDKIGKPLDRGEWDMTPTAVNAYYDPSMNEMVFPAGIFQNPFYDRKAPGHENYSGIGMVMGHELTHGFDDEGRKFDAQGRLRDWWSPQVTREFDKRAACVVHQYASVKLAQNLHVNGKLTAGENIADLGGIKTSLAAWRATQPNATVADTRNFFLHFAQSWCTKTKPELERLLLTVDPHSPPRLRVNVPLADLPDFAAAYGCAAGSKMNPTDRCKVW